MKADRLPGGRHQVVGKKMSVDEALTEVEKDIIFYDESAGGVTFSGGEPLYQAPFLQAMLKACRAKEIHTAVDTSGYAPAEIFAKICDMIDVVLFDLKLMDDDMHRRYTGVSNEKILENLQTLSGLNTPHHIRFPLIPGITDTNENVVSVAEFTRDLGSVNRIDILPMHRIADGKYRRLGMRNQMANRQLPSAEKIKTIKKQFEDFGFTVTVGG
jgi:pyruvate formate lyase activating enzyme